MKKLFLILFANAVFSAFTDEAVRGVHKKSCM